jgi:hypothetical protein
MILVRWPGKVLAAALDSDDAFLWVEGEDVDDAEKILSQAMGAGVGVELFDDGAGQTSVAKGTQGALSRNH